MRDILERLICLALLQMYIPVYCIECVYIVPIVRTVIPLQLLGGEVYHYSTKLMMKEPLIGGRQEWHQDYG